MRDSLSSEEYVRYQLAACRQVLDATLYDNNQYLTVIRLKEVELAEAYQQIEHLQKRLASLCDRSKLPMNPVGYMRE